MKRMTAGHFIYLLVVLSLLLGQPAFATGAPQLFDSALATPDPFNSPLPGPTPAGSETPLPPPPATGTPLPSATPEITATGTLTPSPTPVISPTLTPSATPVISPTVTPAPAVTPSPAPALSITPTLALTLSVEPGWVEPGGIVTFTLLAANPSLSSLPAVALSDTLPGGLVFVPGSMSGLPLSMVRPLTWQIDSLAPGQVISATFQAHVSNLEIGETVTNTVGAASPALAAPLSAFVPIDVVPTAASDTLGDPASGRLVALAG